MEKPAESIDKEEAKTSTREEGDSDGEGMLKTTRTIKPSLLNWKYAAVAFMAALAAVLVYLLLREDWHGSVTM